MKYKFETPEFGISAQGIHLLRNRYNYQTYSFQDIDTIQIGQGRLVNNWILIFLIGLALTAGALYYIYNLYLAFIEERVSHFYVEQILIPVLPLFVGMYCLWTSLRKGKTLTILYNGKTKCLPLVRLEKNNQLEVFRCYLHEQDSLKGKVV
ncbi:hypothetical protein [Xanthocytophaga agilis]|uniref:Uncharacterized protein n=1 Tax=Xanthocytophaga agilis TaxID=3048010 RepID=A0AAE3UCK5_9BACT|nr:hypothetical protein [Xanthocytophaga agilis]MDJ1499471.1 hypothetical protein [Xanthocytophaga agilis]